MNSAAAFVVNPLLPRTTIIIGNSAIFCGLYDVRKHNLSDAEMIFIRNKRLGWESLKLWKACLGGHWQVLYKRRGPRVTGQRLIGLRRSPSLTLILTTLFCHFVRLQIYFWCFGTALWHLSGDDGNEHLFSSNKKEFLWPIIGVLPLPLPFSVHRTFLPLFSSSSTTAIATISCRRRLSNAKRMWDGQMVAFLWTAPFPAEVPDAKAFSALTEPPYRCSSQSIGGEF